MYLLPFSETIPPIWFDVTIDYIPECRLQLIKRTSTEALLHMIKKLARPEVQLKLY